MSGVRGGVVPRGHTRDSYLAVGVGASRMGLRGGITYLHSRNLLSSMGATSGYATAGAIALTALDML